MDNQKKGKGINKLCSSKMTHKLRLYISFGIVIVHLLGCKNSNPFGCTINEKIVAKNDSIMNIKNYKGSLPEIWKDLNEPDIETSDTEAFRLTISHSFDKKIWTYRIEKTTNGTLLTIHKTYSKIFSSNHNINDTTIVKPLSKKDWERISAEFYENCFWTLPMTDDDRGLDGNTYLLEAKDPDAYNPTSMKYFIASRWEPKENTPFKDICDAVLGLDK